MIEFRLSEELREKEAAVDHLEEAREAAARGSEGGGGGREAELERRILELEARLEQLGAELEKRSGGWGWDDGEEMQTMQDDSPAIFGVPNHHPHPANSSSNNHQHRPASSQVVSKVVVDCRKWRLTNIKNFIKDGQNRLIGVIEWCT